LSRFDFKPITPVSVLQPFQNVSTMGQEAGFPLFHDVEILVYHQSWIIEEVFRVSAQIYTSPSRRGERVPMQARKERLFDNLDTHNVIAEELRQGDSHGVWQRCPPSHRPFSLGLQHGGWICT
jgi:hypothetical protein